MRVYQCKVYYSLEKSGYISTSDVDVSNNSEILFIESSYNNSYTVSGVGATTFDISIPEYPEKLSYNQGNTDKLSYTTKSAAANGGVKFNADYLWRFWLQETS